MLINNPEQIIEEIAEWQGTETDYWKGVEILEKYEVVDYWKLKKIKGGCDCYTSSDMTVAILELREAAKKLISEKMEPEKIIAVEPTMKVVEPVPELEIKKKGKK